MFLPYKNENGCPAPWEYLPAGAITPKCGMALTVSSGLLAVCSGTTRPTYISMMESAEALTSGTIIPVIRVDDETIFKTELSADGSALVAGNKVTIDTTGMMVTATTTSGKCEIISMDGTAEGDAVYVRIPD